MDLSHANTVDAIAGDGDGFDAGFRGVHGADGGVQDEEVGSERGFFWREQERAWQIESLWPAE